MSTPNRNIDLYDDALNHMSNTIDDLAEEADWESSDNIEFTSLELAGLEEANKHQPTHDFNSVHDYISWWSDGEDSRYEAN